MIDPRPGRAEEAGAGEQASGFVSRGGLKLAAALDAFELDVAGMTCTDLGSSVGGFTDCLLQRGAEKVYAVDTAYGLLAWKLRQDPRVVVVERTNVLHFDPLASEGVDLVTLDLGWTPQARAIPAALKWKPRRIVSLVKPQYEAPRPPGRGGVLEAEEAERVALEVLGDMEAMGVAVQAHLRSPILGGGSRKGGGNVEYLALLVPSGHD